MGDFGLRDLLTIMGSLLLFGVAIVAVMALIAAWPTIAQFVHAARRRYLVITWPDFVARVADDDMSTSGASEVVRAAIEPPEPLLVRSDTDAERTSSQEISEPIREPSTLQNRDALILHLAQLRYSDGKHCLSANAIYSAVGGTAADVKARIAAVRGGAPAPRSMQKGERLARPEGGW